MRSILKIALIISVASSFLAGCATNQSNLYYWGEYETLIHDMYLKPGTADPTAQVQKLTTDIQRAEARGKAVPPGVYAHLGFMYALLGNMALSKDAFTEEKNRFPEAAIFINGMMKRAMNNKEENHASN